MLNGERPILFSRKAQKKPLFMLKALIALGGKNVEEGMVSGLLWPGAEGDLAHKVFEITLHRLRRLVGNASAVQLREGRLTLDAGYCWVDTWAFHSLCEMAEDIFRDVGDSVPGQRKECLETLDIALRLSEKAFKIYKGHFLPGDTTCDWTASCRERLRSKFHRLVTRLGQYWEHSGYYERAIESYRRGLEIDDLVESFYQRLMVCYQQLGQRAEAVVTYQRCREVLLKTLGIEPSPKTEEIYHTIRTGKT